MDSQSEAVNCLCDDLLKALHYAEDPQCQMSDAEVMTTAIVSALFFGGNHERARSRKKGGTGLGLAIAKSIVEGHGGRIEAHSMLNLGTTMRFYLPLASS